VRVTFFRGFRSTLQIQQDGVFKYRQSTELHSAFGTTLAYLRLRNDESTEGGAGFFEYHPRHPAQVMAHLPAG
jgi:hypothetical protein